MEGYTDITGSLDSFDDLDIEGKSITDDWNGKDDTSFKSKNSKQAKNQPAGFDEKALLSEKVLLNDGSQGFCYTVKESDRCMRWTCHVCNTTVPGAKNFQLHLLGKKHEGNMFLPHHDRSNFTKILNKKEVEKFQLAPGEPVPPGFEDEVEVEAVLQIQPALDNYKQSPLIGLEYLVELVEAGKEPQYNCVLCNKKGDPRTVISHLISQNHRLSYIEKHFTLTFNAINNLPKTIGARKGEIITRVASKIEEKYGRLPPVIADADSFESRRDTIVAQIDNGSHFSEAPDDMFVDLVDKNLVTIGIKADEVPPAESKPAPQPDDDDEVEFQGAFIKGTRVAVDRKALRVRNIEDMVETEDKKTTIALKKATDTKKEKKKIGAGDDSTCPLSPISSKSSPSVKSLRRTRSRSPSPPRRMRSRSRSRSRSRNRSLRQRYSRRSRSLSRGRRRRSRSRSRSRRRSRSGSRGRRLRSPYASYRSSRNPRDRPRQYLDHKKEDRKEKVEDLSTEKAKWERFREDCDKVEKDLREILRDHEKNPEQHPQYPEEWKFFWNRRYKELQSVGIDPSKHDFKPEWIEFWNTRMREMHEAEFTKKKEEIRERLGLPPDNPDPNLKMRFPRKRPVIDHPADHLEPISPDEEKRDPVAEMKSTWKAFTGSDIRESKLRSRSPSPWEENVGRSRISPPDLRRGPREKEMRHAKEPDFGSSRYRRESSRSHVETVRTISVLRTLTALEHQLGSLGPKVNTLLSEAIALDKIYSGNSDAILANDENCVLFETVKEKLKGQLYAGIIDRNMIGPTKQAIQSITELLDKAPSLLQHIRPAPVKKVEPVVIVPVVVEEPPIISEPVTVPGIGAVDKVAIAQQIAAALVAQGKTDVTQEELEQLINAVVGMAQASVDAQEPISTAEFVNSLTKAAEPPAPANVTASPLEGTESIGADENSRSFATLSEDRRSVSSDFLGPSTETPESVDVLPSSSSASNSAAASNGGSTVPKSSVPPFLSGNAAGSVTASSERKLALNASPPAAEKPSAASRLVKSGYGHEDLTEDDLKMLLQNFKDLSTEEQHGLIVYLKKLEATDMDRVEKLRKFVNLGPPASAAPAPAAPAPAAPAPAAAVPPVQTPAPAPTPAAPPKRVETSTGTTTATSRSDSKPLSPFSLRHGGANPTRDLDARRAREEALEAKLMELDDSDDDYTFEDVYAAASQKVKEKMAEEERKQKEKQAEEARLREEREKDRQEKEEQDRIGKVERERKEKEDVQKWEAGNAALSAAARVSSASIPSGLESQTDHSILLKQTTEVLDDLMGNLPSRFNKQAAAAAAAAASAAANVQQPATTGAETNSRPIPIAGAPNQSTEPVNTSYSNYYGNPPFNQPPQQNQPPPGPANGYNNFYNQGNQYRQLVYPGQPDQNQSCSQNQVPVPMAQNPYPPPQPVHAGYYQNQSAGMYQGQNYQNPANYQNYNNPQQMYGQGYGQQMYPQQPGQYGQYNQQSYY